MVRRSTPAAARFPVGLRVAVPGRGFGPQLEAMQAWLEAQLGPDAFSMEGRQGEGDVLFRFLDPTAAKAFIDRFACGVMRSEPLREGRPQ